MDFRMLGPLRIRSGNTYQAISSHRHRKMLAALLVDANTPVSTGRLIDVLWGVRPPTTARQQVQNCVGSLRTVLRKAGHQAVLDRRGESYVLEIADDLVDGLTFCRLHRKAENHVARSELTEAGELLRSALALWHGQALEDIGSDALVADATRLEELRIRAMEALVELEFARGNQTDIIADLSVWVQLYPYHEGLHCRLAEALHEASRTADALNVIRPLKTRLDVELGINAGPSVRSMERKLLGLTDIPYHAVPTPAKATGAGRDGVPYGASGGVSRLDAALISTITTALEDLSTAVHRLVGDGRVDLAGGTEHPGDR
ncbi:AfsR/SARP family transcriptional regulator [Plantactinospora sp. KLBMP9567]|uniref:AfsR/SARP family transcriptional regulator n=1 Tax=Plantactinospora sp. KLBMP9567 TaxID=3085900 RepID=UPI002980DEC1|nr:AfsR/SARP family transcriptional regulator [Plantactinospora sp. KLBMP9567]MDW5328529.1 AfsR/SARP family transcriptional regulator [Plantactinospora sp. KLBMP9567]